MFILSTFGTKNCAEYVLLYDFKILMFNWDRYLFSRKILASNIQVHLFALSVPLCSNFLESPGIIFFL